jgi:glutathione peroxidase
MYKILIHSFLITFFSIYSSFASAKAEKVVKTKTNSPINKAQVKTKPMQKKGSAMDSLLNMELETLNKTKVKLSDFNKTKVFLIVNTASKCGYTNQYEGLEALHKKYKDKGFAVIGFPSNDFGAQEPGSNNEIQEFCKLNFGVTFPLMAKAPVVGSSAQPFYQQLLKLSENKSDVGWNFEKFLITKDQGVVDRYKSSVKPQDLDAVISKLLN